MEDPRFAPTAADYAREKADRAHEEVRETNKRLRRIEAALVPAGLMEPEPEPPPVKHVSVTDALKAHYSARMAEIFAEEDK